jgi:hypothetical protein
MKILESPRFHARQHVGKLGPGYFEREAQGRQAIGLKVRPASGNSVFMGVGAMILTTPGPGHLNCGPA